MTEFQGVISLLSSVAVVALLLGSYSLYEVEKSLKSGELRGPQGEPGPQGPQGEKGNAAPGALPDPDAPRVVRVMRHTHEGWKEAEWVREGTPHYERALRTPGEAIREPNGSMLLGDQV